MAMASCDTELVSGSYEFDRVPVTRTGWFLGWHILQRSWEVS